MFNRALIRSRSTLFETLETRRLLTGSLDVFGYRDADGDGTYEPPADTNVGVWRVDVHAGTPDTPTGPTVTYAGSTWDGHLQIDDLPAGVYTLTNLNTLSSSQYWTSGPQIVATVSDNIITPATFGFSAYQERVISVMDDQNANGLFERGEGFLPGVRGFGDYNANGVFDAGEPFGISEQSGGLKVEQLRVGMPITIDTGANRFVSGQPTSTPDLYGQSVSLSGVYAIATRDTGTSLAGRAVLREHVDSDYFFYNDIGVAGQNLYLDTDLDGMLDAGEPSTVTGLGGQYLFANLAPGTYTVRRVETSQIWQTVPANSGGRTVTLAAGDKAVALNFGLADSTVTPPFADLGVFVFVDDNQNGQVDSFESVADYNHVIVYSDTNLNNVIDPGEPVAESSSQKGLFFNHLTPGLNHIRFRINDAFTVSAGQSSYDLNIRPGDSIQLPPLFLKMDNTLSGRVFNDPRAWGGGAGSATESVASGIANRTLFVDLNFNDQLDAGEPTTVSKFDGTWAFFHLPNGDHSIRQVVPTGYVQTTPFDDSGYIRRVFKGGFQNSLMFGTAPASAVQASKATVSGRFFHDPQADGVRSDDEGVVPILGIFDDRNHNGVAELSEPTAYADDFGRFLLRNLPVGAHDLRVVGYGKFTTPISITTAGNEVINLGDVGFQNEPTESGLSGVAFNDIDFDGVQDPNEPGVPNLQVTAFRVAANGSVGTYAWGVTDSAGMYYMNIWGDSSLPISIGIFEPNGWNPDSFISDLVETTTFTPNHVAGDIDFAMHDPNTTSSGAGGEVVSGGTGAKGIGITATGGSPVTNQVVYDDANNNSRLDAGERTTTSDGSGNFSFFGLSAGLHRFRQKLAVGVQQVSPANNAPLIATLAAGQYVNDLVFSNQAASTPPPPTPGPVVTGTVFNDKNKNGKADTGETGLVGFTAWIDLDGDAVIDAGERTALTDTAGAFSLPVGGLTAVANTRLRIKGLSGYTQTLPASNYGYVIKLGNTAANTAKPFGFYASTVTPPPPTGGASVTGTVYLDKNKNTQRDAGDTGLAGYVVFLDLDGDKIFDTGETQTVTLADGSYTLAGLSTTGSGANTRVRILLPSGVSQTAPTNGYGFVVNLTGTTINAGKDFGVFISTVTPPPPPPTVTGTIRGVLFGDSNKNGIFDSGEAVAGNRRVWLDLDDDGVLDANEQNVYSDASGVYSFTGLAARTYHVRRVFPTGYVESGPARYITVPAAGGVFGNVNIGSKTK